MAKKALKAKAPDLSGPTYKYLGHFAKSKHVAEGHNLIGWSSPWGGKPGPGGTYPGGGPAEGGPGSSTPEPHDSPWYRGTATTDVNGNNPRPVLPRPTRLQNDVGGRAIRAARRGRLVIGDPTQVTVPQASAAGQPLGSRTYTGVQLSNQAGKKFRAPLNTGVAETGWAENRLRQIEAKGEARSAARTARRAKRGK